MGGKNSKSKDVKKQNNTNTNTNANADQNKSSSLSSVSIKEHISSMNQEKLPKVANKIEKQNTDQPGMEVEQTDQPRVEVEKTEQEMYTLFIKSLIETLVTAEPVNSSIQEFDQSDFGNFNKNAKQVYFIQAFHNLLSNPTQMQHIIDQLTATLENLLEQNPSSDEVNMLMLCVSTGFRLLRIP